MSSLKALGVSAAGGLGVLVAGLIISKLGGFGLEKILSAALIIFVLAGAVALVMRAGGLRI